MATIDLVQATKRGDKVTVIAIVDNIEYTIERWWSHIQSLFPGGATNAQKKVITRTYLANELKAEADNQATTPIDISGTPIVLS